MYSFPSMSYRRLPSPWSMKIVWGGDACQLDATPPARHHVHKLGQFVREDDDTVSGSGRVEWKNGDEKSAAQRTAGVNGCHRHDQAVQLVGRLLPLDEIGGGRHELVVAGLHPLLGQRAGVLDGLLADLAEARIHRRIVLVGGLAVQHAARAKFGEEGRVFRIIGQFRLFAGVQVEPLRLGESHG